MGLLEFINKVKPVRKGQIFGLWEIENKLEMKGRISVESEKVKLLTINLCDLLETLAGGIFKFDNAFKRKINTFWLSPDGLRFASDKEVIEGVLERIIEQKKLKKAHERVKEMKK